MPGSELGKLAVKIIADTKDFDKGIGDAKKGTDNFDKQLTSLSGTVKKLLGAGALIAVAKKIADIGVASINAASDAQETQNKFDVVFSGISDYANQMAEDLATAYGTSIQGAKDMLAGTGDLLTGLGFTQESAFSLSEQVLTLGADLASFTNYSGGAEGASEALTKALLGEREMLKGLGISINEADLKAEVLRQTEEGLTFATEKQAKSAATLTLVMNQSKNAMGDFERSSDSYANVTKKAEAAVNDLQVEMGRALLPTATSVKTIFGELTGKLATYIRSINDLRVAEKAQELGIATKQQDLLLLDLQKEKILEQIEAEKRLFETQDENESYTSEFARDNVRLLELQLTGKERLIGEIKGEIAVETQLAEDKAHQAEIDAKTAQNEEEASRIKEENYRQQLDFIDDVILANKSEITVIDEQIQQLKDITGLTESENEKRLESIKLLQTDKQAILDEERTEREKDYNDRLAKEIENNNLIYEESKKLKDKRIALKQEEADFVVGIAGSILDIYKGYNQAQIDSGEKTADEIYQINLNQFRAEQTLALSQIAIDTAIGVAKVYGQTGIFGLGAQVPVIAAGALQAVAVMAEQPPSKPQLATGAYIPGSARGKEVIVGENNEAEDIYGMGERGRPRRNQLAMEVAAEVKKGGGGGNVYNYYSSTFAPLNETDMRRFTRMQRPYLVADNQRIGADR